MKQHSKCDAAAFLRTNVLIHELQMGPRIHQGPPQSAERPREEPRGLHHGGGRRGAGEQSEEKGINNLSLDYHQFDGRGWTVGYSEEEGEGRVNPRDKQR